MAGGNLSGNGGTRKTVGRDADRGGDDWAKPTLNYVAGQYDGITWGDFSNMNGGSFSPDHDSHRTGNDVDAKFAGYSVRDANTANQIISQLNNSTCGSMIQKVYVTYAATAENPFWNAIKNVTLNDGRLAKNVIVKKPNHTTHFHWRTWTGWEYFQ